MLFLPKVSGGGHLFGLDLHIQPAMKAVASCVPPGQDSVFPHHHRPWLVSSLLLVLQAAQPPADHRGRCLYELIVYGISLFFFFEGFVNPLTRLDVENQWFSVFQSHIRCTWFHGELRVSSLRTVMKTSERISRCGSVRGLKDLMWAYVWVQRNVIFEKCHFFVSGTMKAFQQSQKRATLHIKGFTDGVLKCLSCRGSLMKFSFPACWSDTVLESEKIKVG